MKQIKIMGHMFDLILEDNYINNREINGQGNQGLVKYIEKTIIVDSMIKGYFEIILHECLHVLGDKLSISLEENEINRLSEGLYCLLKDNDWLIPDIEKKLERFKLTEATLLEIQALKA